MACILLWSSAVRVHDSQAYLVERLDKASTAYGMEISAEKTKLMTNNTSGINTEIKVNGQNSYWTAKVYAHFLCRFSHF